LTFSDIEASQGLLPSSPWWWWWWWWWWYDNAVLIFEVSKN